MILLLVLMYFFVIDGTFFGECIDAFVDLGRVVVQGKPIASVANRLMPCKVAPEIDLLFCIAGAFR